MSTEKEKFLRRIETSNKRYEAATPEQKRVIVAKDALTRIELEMINPSHGFVLKIPGVDPDDFVNKKVFNHYNCQACAKGALLVSFVGRFNKFHSPLHNASATYASETGHQKLNELFIYDQLALIEYAFEGEFYLYGHTLDPETIARTRKWRNKITVGALVSEGPMLLLKAICKNIIRNKGTFIPPKK
jgi:hypothetical protein